MNSSFCNLWHPLRLAGAFTIAAVALSFLPDDSPHGAWRWSVLVGFTVLFMLHTVLPQARASLKGRPLLSK